MEIMILTQWIFVLLSIFVSEVTPLKCYKCITSEYQTCPKGNDSFIVDCEVHFRALDAAKLTRPSTKGVDPSDYEEIGIEGGPGEDRPEAGKNQTQLRNGTVAKDYVCMKNKFFVKEWTIVETVDVEMKKRMTKPRVSFSCGRAPKGHQGKCVNANTRDITQVLCTCTTDLCNGSGKFVPRSCFQTFAVLLTLFVFYTAAGGI